MTTFVDCVTIKTFGGNGGHGCVSTKREKYKPLGGSDGGDGGNGGSVILKVDPQITTLLSYHRSPYYKASNGGGGKGDFRRGKIGENLFLPVPVGTVVKSLDGIILANLISPDSEYMVSRGGCGGLGNSSLCSPRRKAPGFALLGEPGEENEISLEIKTVADVALVGYPSAGKSSLISVLSSAKPKIADYPFTTLTPNLGVVEAGDNRFTVADVPGLIPGASSGKGLGLDFLRHIERCSVIVHVVDCATLDPGRDPVTDLEVIESELKAYNADFLTPGSDVNSVLLSERPKIVVLNKVDVPQARELAEFVKPDLENKGYKVFIISAVSQEGLRSLCFAMASLVNEDREKKASLPKPKVVIKPQAVDEEEFNVVIEKNGLDDLYRIVGDKPERWILQTDFSNDEAVGYLSDRLAKLGIEEALFKYGAVPGATVIIGKGDGVLFDWEPTLGSAENMITSARGSDIRLSEHARPTRKEKRVRYYENMDAKAAARAELQAEKVAGMWSENTD